MAPSYNLANGCEASYRTSPTGNTTVSIRSTSKLKPRAVYVGAANLEFMWVSSGKSSHWQFTPTLMDQTSAEFTETPEENGQGQVFNINFGSRMFPATGIVKTNMSGAIMAPAVHFDLPHAYDLWVFLIRSPWFPLKLSVEKSPLTIAHGGAQAMATVETSSFDEGKSLRIDSSVHGEGFKNIYLTLKRKINMVSVEETIGTVGSFTWAPFLRSLDAVLVTYSDVTIDGFIGFLNSIGAEAKTTFFSFGTYLPRDFLLCDGVNMEYTLSLKGEKRFIGHEADKTKITLNY